MAQLSSTQALVLLLFTTIIWGSWYQCIKRLNGWPVAAFMLWMYTFSMILVWGIIWIISPYFIQEPIWNIIREHPKSCLFALCSGMFFCAGVQINMVVIKNVGLILSTSISATCSVLVGTFTSCLFGGIREGQSVLKIAVASMILIAAAIICQFASKMRDTDNGKNEKDEAYRKELKIRMKNTLFLLFGAVFLNPAYSIAQSVTVQTDLKPDGIPALLCVGLLSIGSCLGTWIISGIQLTRNRQWGECFSWKNRTGILMSLFSAFCHYGGNIGYCISAPVLSYAVAWPMGTSFNLWQYVYGILYGEFNKTNWKTKATLAAGIICFIAGVLILS